jgi:hypothetical protein
MGKRWLGLWLIVLLALAGFGPPEQGLPDALTLDINAGFEGHFRDGQWLPLFIRVSNDGDDVAGRLIVRPETSGNAISNTYSVPIDLPSGARKTAFLYITARAYASQIRVDLVDNEGLVLAAEPVGLRPIQRQDQLFVVVSQAAAGLVDLTGVRVGGHDAYQANWSLENLPDHPAGLDAVNMMLFSDVDTSGLSSDQQQAIADWVTQGGHLLVTGGTNWQNTAAGLTDLLPMTPDNSSTIGDLTQLASWSANPEDELVEQTVVATGNVQPEAEVLAAAPDGVPLLVRGTVGAGTVDYLTADPGARPLRGWGGLTDVWFTMATTVEPNPSWMHEFTYWNSAASAVEVFPGYNILPEVLPLCGFLAAYIGLVGPLNYLVLSRINRREYAWITIPAFIILFSVLAWVTGFNLRGNEARVSRISLVQSWPDTDRAHVEQLIGLLSPRRTQYSLSMDDGSFLRPIPRNDARFLTGNVELSTEIQQSDVFRAADFSVDASIIASFNASGVIEKPAISGQANLFYDGAVEELRGSVRNDSDVTLTDAVILARGVSLRLTEPLEPGEVETFNLTLAGEGPPAPSPMGDAPGVNASPYGYAGYGYSYNNSNLVPFQTMLDILGDQYNYNSYYAPPESTAQTEEIRRRQFFMESFLIDYYYATGRGNNVYLAGWSDTAPLSVNLEGANWSAQDTTLYFVELEVEFTPPTEQVLVSRDQFTWVVRERTGLNDVNLQDLSLQPGDEVVLRFTPLPNSQLSRVKEIVVEIGSSSAVLGTMPLYLWDWRVGDWEEVEVSTSGAYNIRNPARFLGPQNAVELRIVADDLAGYTRIFDLAIEQLGEF